MFFRLKPIKDTYIVSNTSISSQNFGQDQTLQIYKNSVGKGHSLVKFDMTNLYDYVTTQGLAISSISANLKMYDVSSYAQLNPAYTNENKFVNCDVEVLFCNKNFDEGIYSLGSTGTGYCNWSNADNNNTWDDAGGSVSSITSLTTLTQTFLQNYDNVNINIKTYLDYLVQSYTGSAVDLNKGFLFRLTSAYESSTGTYDKKELISMQSKITSYRPEIVINYNKFNKSDEGSFEYNKNNTFTIINLDSTTYNPLSITSITSATLKGYVSNTSVTAAIVSTASSIAFTTTIKGSHTFLYNIPNSLTAYYTPYLEVTFNDTNETKTKIFTLIRDHFLTEEEAQNITFHRASLYFVSPKNNIELLFDTIRDVITIPIYSVYSFMANQTAYFNFDTTIGKILKNLQYRISDGNNKVIIDWEQCHYSKDTNYILLDDSMVDQNQSYFIDLKFNDFFTSKAVTFKVV